MGADEGAWSSYRQSLELCTAEGWNLGLCTIVLVVVDRVRALRSTVGIESFGGHSARDAERVSRRCFKCFELSLLLLCEHCTTVLSRCVLSRLEVAGDESIADRRQTGAPTEDDMVIAELGEDNIVVIGGGTVSGERGDSGVGAMGESSQPPYMRGRLRAKADYWRSVGASPMVMGWILVGFLAWFTAPVPYLSLLCLNLISHRALNQQHTQISSLV